MTIFKCKMCGGSLEINNETVATCEYCGTMQTIPRLTDERRAGLYERANQFRLNNEYDKSLAIYNEILIEDNTDAEAYWSIVLCHYGIEYVEDPTTNKRIPTINRAQYTSIFDDVNYKEALKYADGSQRVIYEQEAKTINEIQKQTLEISQKEEPYDIFICYKESDDRGRRTIDSVLAQNLYTQLEQEGFKVFFARITLEDKLGSAYEPYIFAALNTSKVMIVVTTKPEHVNAVWVKNEWSRYLAHIKNGENKLLIPAYKDMDPYDLPAEFAHLQAQDMSKIGFEQDLIRGIKKVVNVTAASNSDANIANAVQEEIKRREAEKKKKTLKLLKFISIGAALVGLIVFIILYGYPVLIAGKLVPYINYNRAVNQYEKGNYEPAYAIFDQLGDYKDSQAMKDNIKLEEAYISAMALLDEGKYDEAIAWFEQNVSYKDSESKLIEARQSKWEDFQSQIIEQLERGEYLDAYNTLTNNSSDLIMHMTDYENRVAQAFEGSCDLQLREIKGVTKGEIITLGFYEEVEIEWKVLDIVDGKALLLCSDVITSMKYADRGQNNIWSYSIVRSWLNETFLYEAFSSEIQNKICDTDIVNKDIMTTDKMFILSGEEVDFYNVRNDNPDKFWLRNEPVNVNTQYLNCVNFPVRVDGIEYGVRPAMWISIE